MPWTIPASLTSRTRRGRFLSRLARPACRLRGGLEDGVLAGVLDGGGGGAAPLEEGGVVVLAELGDGHGAALDREAGGVGLDADGVHQVAEVLVDGLGGDRGGSSGAVQVGERAAVDAVTVAVSDRQRGVGIAAAVVLDADRLAGLEVVAAAPRLQDRQVVEVVAVAVRHLLEPDRRA